ncbi:hypothetical protein [Paraliobacillus ryukyuensis]|uniref:hypothetical protein n=1 Tax=Paraliobacillus ryukyuensis TaxID=200904 RepID=UPI0009A75553|nr:hypothetical protein [Paraliobacillus ryukyuensis]
MKKEEEFHILAKELLVFYDELDHEVKVILDNHFNDSEEYREIKSMSSFGYMEKEIKEERGTSGALTNEFKSLKLFRQLIMGLLILSRAILIFSLFSGADINMTVIKADAILYYVPLIIVANILTFVGFRRRVFWSFLTFDMLFLLAFLLF